VSEWEPADAEFVADDDEVEYEEGYGSEDHEEDAPASPPTRLRRSRRKRPSRRITRVQVLRDEDEEDGEDAQEEAPPPKKTRVSPQSNYTLYGAEAVLIPAGLAGCIDATRVPRGTCHICGLDRIDADAPETWHVSAALIDKMNAPVPLFPVCDECARRVTDMLLEGESFVLYGDVAKPTTLQRTAKRD
jgi:hypothetical protein